MSDAAQCCQKPEVFEACPVKKAQDEKNHQIHERKKDAHLFHLVTRQRYRH